MVDGAMVMGCRNAEARMSKDEIWPCRFRRRLRRARFVESLLSFRNRTARSTRQMRLFLSTESTRHCNGEGRCFANFVLSGWHAFFVRFPAEISSRNVRRPVE